MPSKFRNSRCKMQVKLTNPTWHLDAHATQVESRYSYRGWRIARQYKDPCRWPLIPRVFPCVDHVSSIFCHHFLISFGTRYSGIWHIDHICFAIWIWDRFPWICFIHWLYVFHVIILLQFLWPDKGYTSLKQRTDGSLFLSTSAWCQVSIPSNQCMLRSG